MFHWEKSYYSLKAHRRYNDECSTRETMRYFEEFKHALKEKKPVAEIVQAHKERSGQLTNFFIVGMIKHASRFKKVKEDTNAEDFTLEDVHKLFLK